MQCPKDKHLISNIFSKEVNIEIDVCEQCGGVWFDEQELAKAAAHLRVSLPPKSGKDQMSAHVPDTHRYHPPQNYVCPKDGKSMNEHAYAGDSGIYINHCDHCLGFWFDGGELEKLKNYLAPSPLLEGLGSAMVAAMKESERKKQEAGEMLVKMHVMFSSPASLVLMLLEALARYMLAQANREQSGDTRITKGDILPKF